MSEVPLYATSGKEEETGNLVFIVVLQLREATEIGEPQQTETHKVASLTHGRTDR